MNHSNNALAAVVLAAGKGKRMRSDAPKVLFPVCGRPVLGYVLDEVDRLRAGDTAIVVGHGAHEVREAFGPDRHYIEQAEQRGTGHAVMLALEDIDERFEEVLVLPGDSPLIRYETLGRLVDVRREEDAAATMLTAELPDPRGYGRVVRDGSGAVSRIVEEADADDDEKMITEVNACTYAFDRRLLEPVLEVLTDDNAQSEYYITGVVEHMVAGGHKVIPVRAPVEEALGINDREQLSRVEALMRKRINAALMRWGVSMPDPGQVYVDHGVDVGRDTVIMPMSFLTGATGVGGGCRIGPCVSIKDSRVGEGCKVEFSWLEGCEVGRGVDVGPFSRLRPGTRIGPEARVGSFVEIKNSTIGRGSKVPHLSYIGDATIGENVNVGAGTITCNYDGEKKHRTEIGDRAFLGSDTMLIAPVRVGDDAVTAAGSAIYEDVPDGSLGIERSVQHNKPGWRAKRKGGGKNAGSGRKGR